MADITNRQAINFLTNKARPLADLMEKVRRSAEQFAIDIVTEFEANVGENAGEDVIADGSGTATDGRQIVTKDGMAGLKYVAEQMVACLNQDDRETLVGNVSVDGRPIF